MLASCEGREDFSFQKTPKTYDFSALAGSLPARAPANRSVNRL